MVYNNTNNLVLGEKWFVNKIVPGNLEGKIDTIMGGGTSNSSNPRKDSYQRG